VLGAEGASSDSALIGCVVHFGKRQLLPHIRKGSRHGAVIVTLDSPEFIAEREQGLGERNGMKVYFAIVGMAGTVKSPSLEPIEFCRTQATSCCGHFRPCTPAAKILILNRVLTLRRFLAARGCVSNARNCRKKNVQGDRFERSAHTVPFRSIRHPRDFFAISKNPRKCEKSGKNYSVFHSRLHR